MTTNPAPTPLANLTVVVTRPRERSEAFGSSLAELGAEVIYLPTVAILDPESWASLDQSIARLAEGEYDWVLFTSASSVERFFLRLEEASAGKAPLRKARVGAVGRSSARLLQEHGVTPDIVPDEFTGEALSRSLEGGSGRILLPRAADAPGEVIELLGRAGWSVEEVVAYRNIPPPADTAEAQTVRAGRFDIVTFTSASTARNFARNIAGPRSLGLSPDAPPDRLVACIGPKTAEGATCAGFRVDLVADEHTAEGLTRALVGLVAANRRNFGAETRVAPPPSYMPDAPDR